MTTKLTIRWDGTAPGLQEHALSLSAWLGPLRALLVATRRAASNLEMSRTDEPDRGARGGRLAPGALALDLRITSIERGSLALNLECTQAPVSGQQVVFRDLPARALAAVVSDIKAAASGRRKNGLAATFLRALPPGVSTQEYAVEHDGELLAHEKIEESTVESSSSTVPRLERIEGFLIGVGFEPGRSTITVKTRGQKVTRPASEALVQNALHLRGMPIVAMCVSGESPRVLWLRPASEESTVASPQERSAILRSRWSRTLELLAK